MRAIISFFIALLLFSTIIAVVPGCDDSLDFANTPPGGLTISRSVCYLGENDQVVLTGEATDADGDSISYRWTAADGTLTPSDGRGKAVTWQAPDSHGTFRVTLHVTDGLDESAKGVDLDVGRNLEITYTGGVISETDYPYIVPNALPINISELITVTIEEGVTIVFNEGGGGFHVGGTLNINGTLQNKVLFIPNKCPGEERTWRGIEFTGSSARGNFNYVTLTSSADGITVEENATLTADNLIVDQTTADGLAVKTGASATITDSRFWDNGGGIYVAQGTLDIRGSSIRYNNNYGFSMISSTYAVADIRDCVIANNGQWGIVLAEYSSPVVHNCSMFFNGPSAEARTVKFINTYLNTNAVDMTGNFWGTDDPMQIQPQIVREGANGIVDFSGWLSDDPL